MTEDPAKREPGAAPSAAASLSMVKIRRQRRSPSKSASSTEAQPSPQAAAKAARQPKAPAPIAALPPPVPFMLLAPPTQAAPPGRAAAPPVPTIVLAPRPATDAAPAPLPVPKPQAAPPSTALRVGVSTPVVAFASKAAAPAPAKRVEPIEPAPQRSAPQRALRPHDDADLVAYWNELRGGRALPLFALLDRERVAASWPDSLTVTYTENDAAMPHIKRLSKPTGEIEYSPMVTDWILSCAREVARLGRAMEDVQEFPSSAGLADYHLLLLPFATPQSRSTHVVCRLSRASRERAARG